MPHTSAVYHLDFSGRIPPGQLFHIEDHEGGVADVYLHPLHVRANLVWDLNWLVRHQVGHGYWRQRWTEGDRMQRPAEGLGIAVSRWEIVPASEMPRNRYAFPVEEEGSCIWLIRSGYCTTALMDEMNVMHERAVGDGLWVQVWEEGRWPPVPRPVSPAPLLASQVSV